MIVCLERGIKTFEKRNINILRIDFDFERNDRDCYMPKSKDFFKTGMV